MAFLAMSQLAYGQACGNLISQVATVEPAGSTFIILVPVQGQPVQYQPIRVTHQCAPYYPADYHYGYRPQYRYRYNSGYGSGYRTFHHTSRYFRHPNGRVYLVPRNGR